MSNRKCQCETLQCRFFEPGNKVQQQSDGTYLEQPTSDWCHLEQRDINTYSLPSWCPLADEPAPTLLSKNVVLFRCVRVGARCWHDSVPLYCDGTPFIKTNTAAFEGSGIDRDLMNAVNLINGDFQYFDPSAKVMVAHEEDIYQPEEHDGTASE